MARQARLCDLITNSLLPFTEKRNCDASKELEKKLLLALSDVYKEIQQLNELNKIEEESSVIHKCVLQKEKSFSEECKCISNIISTMVFFIECESEFIQHVTGIGKNDSDDDLFEETNSNLNFKLLDLVPNIISCFLDSSNNCLHQYMRHKMLMLMIRLISHTKLQKGPHIILYLNSLKDHFHDLISEPLQNYEITPESCLQESPFFPRRSQNRHLKRRSLFLFFKFCFCLIQTKEEFYSNIGLSEISEWLKLNYIDKSYMNFCLSFVQLYIDEDDMLFNMFLLLLDGSLTNLQIYDHGNKSDYEETIETFSNIFNPVYLFHIFLLLLDYDHLVIIDYLISKDTGVLCAQYILRCLRVISQSWKSFAEFSVSMGELKLNSQSNKRQKSYQSFENAKGCLISLRNSLEDLDKKKLFPYNPKALLKSLAVLKDLCD
ncbi:hypothetical protein LUZ60_010442 [Juncus effusus]|nr:hypothetical protein LUZ60_010442 [Juncus effusus]